MAGTDLAPSIRRAELQGPLAALLALLLIAVLVLRPLVWGVTAHALAGFWITVALLVVAPGMIVCHRAKLCPPGDIGLLVGQGATLGLAIHGLAFLGGRATGQSWIALAIPAAVAVIAVSRRAPQEAEARPAALCSSTTALLAVATVALVTQPLRSTGALGAPIDVDMLFHAGNAAELRHRWPLESPRVAGLPLNYPMLAYALPAQASELFSTPVADNLLGLAPLFWVGLLALQIANVGRILFGDAWAGTLAAAIVLFHADPGSILGLPSGAFNSFLATGIYGSSTTVCGLVLLTGLAISVSRWLQARPRAELVAMVVLAGATAATKASVLPPVLGGLALVALWGLITRLPAVARRAVTAMAAMVVVATPFSIALTSGSASYRGVFFLDPGGVFRRSAFAAQAEGWGIATVPGGTVIAFAAWLVAFLGLAGVGSVAWARLRREPVDSPRVWVLGVAATGLGLALCVGTPDLSQLFFAYNSQLLLAVCAGAGLHLAAATPSRRLGVLLVAVVFALPPLSRLAAVVPSSAAADSLAVRRPLNAINQDYLAGLAWLRTHATSATVVFANNPSLLLSAFGEVQMFYETGLYTPRWWAGVTRGVQEPYPERVAFQLRLMRQPDAAALSAAREAIAPGQRILVVVDSVPSAIWDGQVVAQPSAVPSPRVFPAPRFSPLFENRAIQIYEIEAGRAAHR